jgi:hypothetical protein
VQYVWWSFLSALALVLTPLLERLMLWLSLLVLMLLVSAAPGISMYVEYRSGVARTPVNAGSPTGGEPLPER